MRQLPVFVCLLCVSVVVPERKLPSYITPCKRFDPDISKCWEKTLVELRPHLTEGIPEFNVPPITEFRVNQLHLDQGNTPNVNFIADLYNLTFYGGEKYEVNNTDVNFKTFVLKEGFFFPKLRMDGHYKAKGKVLLFEFEGEGKAEGDFEDVYVNGTYVLKTIQKKGKEYLQVDKSDCDVYPGKIRVYFHNLFRGNPEITKNVNKAINENTDILYNDFRPLLEATITSVLNQYLNRVYGLYPFDVLLPLK